MALRGLRGKRRGKPPKICSSRIWVCLRCRFTAAGARLFRITWHAVLVAMFSFSTPRTISRCTSKCLPARSTSRQCRPKLSEARSPVMNLNST